MCPVFGSIRTALTNNSFRRAGSTYFGGLELISPSRAVLSSIKKDYNMLTMSLKASFLKIYADIPLGARGEIIAVINDEPITWNSARVEIENDTAIGKKILDQLVDLKIIDAQN